MKKYFVLDYKDRRTGFKKRENKFKQVFKWKQSSQVFFTGTEYTKKAS